MDHMSARMILYVLTDDNLKNRNVCTLNRMSYFIRRRFIGLRYYNAARAAKQQA